MDDGQPDDVEGKMYVEAVRVAQGGMITIPKNLRERYGIEPYDVLHAVVYGGDEPFQIFDLVTHGDERIRIPDRKRIIYGIEDGDVVDMEILLTDKNEPDAL